MDLSSILTLIGGLSLFLFGMNYMGDSLKKLSGSRLETVLSKLTSNRFKGFLLGFGVTAVIQSSSAVMVMLVGFVNSGIMQLFQTTSVLMGANIGTTVTAWLLSTSGISGDNDLLMLLKPSAFAAVLGAVGFVMKTVSKSDKRKNVGSIFLGFFILMFGMEAMSVATEGLQESAFFINLLGMFSNPLMGILAGTIFTAIIQSSSASVGILQALSLTSAIPVSSALPIILGMNIGAALPPVLSAISANTEAKRVAVSCVYIKIIGVAVIAVGFYTLHMIIGFGFMDENSTVFSIAFIHTIFNVLSTAVLLPFCRGIEKLSEITLRAETQEADIFNSLDTRFLDYPSFAAGKARELTADMAKLAEQSVNMSLELLHDYHSKIRKEIKGQEKTIDIYEDKLSAYLVALSGQETTASEGAEVTTLLHIIGDVERISDYARNLAKIAKDISEHSITFSDNAEKEIDIISAAVKEIVNLSVAAISDRDSIAALKIESLNRVIKENCKEIKTNHITKLQENEYNIELGFVFSNLLINFRRIAEHCSNIAVHLLQKQDSTFSLHKYKNLLQDEQIEHLQNFYDTYRTQYDTSEHL